MFFQSLTFLLLLLPTILLFRALKGRWRLWVLLLASYLFYAGFEPWFLLLLIGSTLIDYVVGLALDATDNPIARRALLGVSIAVNLGVLIGFKYMPMGLATIGLLPWESTVESQGFHVWGTIPPGLSFYTFQTLSYTIDVYRKRTPATRDLPAFALYVAFFPQLVAGPICRAEDLLEQLKRARPPNAAQVVQAVEIFGVGLFKKVVIANNLGILVDMVFKSPGDYAGWVIVLAGFAFWGQIYADFSGYSTMARGLSKLFGVELPKNFHSPLLARDPLEYRRSWHVTMSEWFRDYVFHPLGGTRRGPVRVFVNILIVWAFFGLWHGPAWTFVAWGLYNGAIQAVNRERLRRGWIIPDYKGKALGGWALNLLFILPSAIVFRASGVGEGLGAIGQIVTRPFAGEVVSAQWVLVCVGLFAVHAFTGRRYDENLLNKVSWPVRHTILALGLLVIVLFAPESRPFVYFQF